MAVLAPFLLFTWCDVCVCVCVCGRGGIFGGLALSIVLQWANLSVAESSSVHGL